MRRLYLLCAALVLVLAGLSVYYRAEPDTFYGIADTKELTISSESGVEIRRILAAPGQSVSQGDTLLELHNPDLDMRISQITHELEELRTRRVAHASLTKSELLHLKAQQEVRVNEIRAEIQELEAKYQLNKNLVSELHSLDREKAATGASAGDNPILVRLESLRKLLRLAEDPSRVNENRLANELSSSGDPLADQVRRREDELRILNEDRARLIILAQMSGLIGSVNFKVGENVSPFAPILTLHAASPSFVRGYIHEDVYSQVGLKQKVNVAGSQERRHRVVGEVVGVGARIVEYPERLRRRPDIRIWGREIIIRLPADNRFLLGEKVLISIPGKRGLAQFLPSKEPAGHASPSADPAPGTGSSAAPASVDPLAVPSSPVPALHPIGAPSVAAAGFAAAPVPGLEASGLLYLPDAGRLLAVSDETPGKRAEAYLLDTAYRIAKTAPIAGLDRMDDIEAVAAGEDGAIYFLSSQSRTRKGKLPPERRWLAKAGRSGEALVLEGKLDLRDTLDALARRAAGAPWSLWLGAALSEGTLDIEGLAWKDGDLYLGVKTPLREGKAVILRLAGADSLLDGKAAGSGKSPSPAAVSVWKELDLRDARTGAACGISELLMRGDATYLLSTGKAHAGGHAGALWVLRRGAEAPVLARDFGGERAEGLAFDAKGDSLYVAFDNGGRGPSMIGKVAVPR
jgi:multidrug resistance efflux pump